MHVELVQLQQWVQAKGLKVCILFEGRDTAGKGGTIKALTERVSPRVFRVVALPAPTERQKSQMYLQRYIGHLPAAGEIVIFDRSWYNRAGVERVMGFCTEQQAKEFLKALPLVEKAIVGSGVILLKYWLEVSPEEQTRRPEVAHGGRAQALEAHADGLEVVQPLVRLLAGARRHVRRDRQLVGAVVRGPSDDKKRARLAVIRHILAKIPHKKVKQEKVKLPERDKARGYQAPDYPYKYLPLD
jgi:polyphosphate kinase 2 (PPK2 family)